MKRDWEDPTEEEIEAFRAVYEQTGFVDKAFEYAVEIGLAAICDECGGNGWVVVGQTMSDPYGEQEQCACLAGFDAPRVFLDITFPPYVPDPDFIKAMAQQNPDEEPLF